MCKLREKKQNELPLDVNLVKLTKKKKRISTGRLSCSPLINKFAKHLKADLAKSRKAWLLQKKRKENTPKLKKRKNDKQPF